MDSFICAVVIILGYATACNHYHDPACQDVEPLKGNYFSNLFPVHIEGDEEDAKRVAAETQFEYVEPVKGWDQHYFFRHPEVPHRHEMRHEEFVKSLRSHEKVLTADQQFVFQPTIAELNSYKDMVGRSVPSEVKFSQFNPDELESERDIPPVRVTEDTPKVEEVRDEKLSTRMYRPLKDVVDLDDAIRNQVSSLFCLWDANC